MAIKTILLSAAGSACVCVPATVHVQHVRAHHAAPVHHHEGTRVRHAARRSAPCPTPVPNAVRLGTLYNQLNAAHVPYDQMTITSGPTNSPLVDVPGPVEPTSIQPVAPLVPLPVGPGPIWVATVPPVTPPPPVAKIPEPATWGLFIGGFGLVGAAMRARDSKAHPDAGGSDAAMARLNAARDHGRRERG